MTGVAVIGASERHIPWTEWLIGTLEQYHYGGPIWLVNPNYEELLGRPCYPSLDALPDVPDIGVLVVGPDQAVLQCGLLVERGCPRIVIVSNGFAELGTPEGRAREAELTRICADHDGIVLGPNCVGFASFHEGLCALTQPVPEGIVAGPVSIVSQSGGLMGAALSAVQREGLGVDMVYSIGNAAAFPLSRAVESVLARPTTRVACCVVESIDDRARIEQAVRTAHEAGKLLVFLTLGRSAGARRVAQSHTGAVVGEQRMIASWLREIGVVIADSAEDLGRIATMFEALGPTARPRRVFIQNVSGGGAGLAADIATKHGVPLAALDASTLETIRGLLPPGAYVGNPLDVSTGDATAVYSAIAADPNVDYMIEPWMLPWPDTSRKFHWQRAGLERIAGITQEHGTPLIIASHVEEPLNDWATELDARPGITVMADLERTMSALGKLYGQGLAAAETAVAEPPRPSTGDTGLVAEAEARAILAEIGLPVVRGAEAPNADAVVAAAADLRRPLALKVSLPAVGHKERVGGVRVGLASDDDLRGACGEIAANAVAAGLAADPAQVGFLVTEMVFGPELLVGALRDPVAGPTLTVGVGGWAAEAGATFGTVLLPKDAEAVLEIARGWRLPRLLGERRTTDLVDFLCSLGAEFASGRLAEYEAVEINPLILDQRGPVVVDALMVR